MTNFEDFNLDDRILAAIQDLNYEKPTPIQEKAIPHLLNESGDLVALAATGTGKTASFGIPLIQKINVANRRPQALILTPTRELSVQVANDLKSFARKIPGIQITGIIGGARLDSQVADLKKGTHVIVATPGRLIDLLGRKKIDTTGIHTVVLDEADEMLNMGFQDAITEILTMLPEEKRMVLFSATMPRDVRRIAQDFMHKPFEIGKGAEQNASSSVKHVYYRVKAHNRYIVLKRIADSNPGIYGIVFCRTRSETKEVAEQLIRDGYGADALHGDLTHAQRESVMNRFRNRNIQLLVATDVAARGLDVNNLTHVINYNLPAEPELYTHRSGRTGRAGKEGVCISIINLREESKLLQFQKRIGVHFERGLVPNGIQVCSGQMIDYLQRIIDTDIKQESLAPYMDSVQSIIKDEDKDELIFRLLSMQFGDLLKYYKKDENLNISDSRDTSRGPGKKRKGRERSRRPRHNMKVPAYRS
jgi:ATP-dependent RNA helicase DeaD